MIVILRCILVLCIFFFKQKTAYEMRISDWSSDVCSSDLGSDLKSCGDNGWCPVHAPGPASNNHGTLPGSCCNWLAKAVTTICLYRPTQPPPTSACGAISSMTPADRKSTRLNSSH